MGCDKGCTALCASDGNCPASDETVVTGTAVTVSAGKTSPSAIFISAECTSKCPLSCPSYQCNGVNCGCGECIEGCPLACDADGNCPQVEAEPAAADAAGTDAAADDETAEHEIAEKNEK